MVQTLIPTTPAAPRPRRDALTPSLDEVTAIAEADRSISTIPVFRETMADLETPVSAFLKIRGDRPAFLLESIEGGERLARYSFIGANPMKIITLDGGVVRSVGDTGSDQETYDDPLVALEQELARYRSVEIPGLALPRFVGRRRRLSLLRGGAKLRVSRPRGARSGAAVARRELSPGR